MIWPVVAYAPTAATKPIIADQPLNLSASGVIVFLRVNNRGLEYTRYDITC